MKASGSLGQLMLLIFPAITACNLNSTEIHFPIPSNVSLPKQQINHYANATMVNDHGVDHLLEMGGSVLGDSFNGRIQIQNLVSNVTSNHEAKCMRSWTCKVDGCHRQVRRQVHIVDSTARPNISTSVTKGRVNTSNACCHTHPVYGDPVTRKRLNRGSVKIGIRECLEKLPHMSFKITIYLSKLTCNRYLTSIHLFQETTFIEVQRTIKVVQPRDCGSNLLQDFEKHIWIPHLCEQNASMAASYLFHDLPYAKGELFCADELRFQVQQVDGPCH
eukprot:691858-Hanusia_phi.AAC.3